MLRGDNKKRHAMESGDAPCGHVEDWENLAIDYLGGQLDAASTAAIKRHLNECPACAERLQRQRITAAFLREIPLEASPAEIENRVLSELQDLSIAPEPLATPIPQRTDRAAWWSTMWRGRIRPWMPAAVGVVAVLVAVVSIGVLRSENDQVAVYNDVTSTVYGEAAPAAADGSDEASALGATPTTAAVTSTTAAGGMTETTSAEASAVTTTSDAATIEATYASAQDRKGMIYGLENADTPAYFVFDIAASEGVEAGQLSEEAVQQITLFTGLEPLEDALSLDGPTFAAFVPRDDAEKLVDLLQSIGATLQVAVGLEAEPPESAASSAALLISSKESLPELTAQRTQPAVSGWTFTTSPLPPAAEGQEEAGDWVAPDEKGTHTLVVIYLRD